MSDWEEHLPPSLDTPEVRRALDDYEQNRKEKRAKATPTAWKRLMAKLEKHGPEIAVLALDHSSDNGYTGCFPEKMELPKEAWKDIASRTRSLAPWWEDIRPCLERMAAMECYDEEARVELADLADRIETMGPEVYYPELDAIEARMLGRAWVALPPEERERVSGEVDSALARLHRGTAEEKSRSRRAMIKAETRKAVGAPSMSKLSMGLERWA